MAAAARPAPILLTASQAAALLGMSRMQVYRMLQDGVWPVVRVGKSPRLARADLEAWVAAQRVDWATGDPWDQPMGRVG